MNPGIERLPTLAQTMNAPTADAITSTELRKLIESSAAPRIVDVRTPAVFETAHIAGSYNVPLDVLDDHTAEIATRPGDDHDVVLVCRSGQRSTRAQTVLRNEGLTGGRVLEKGISDWEGQGFAVDRGAATDAKTILSGLGDTSSAKSAS